MEKASSFHLAYASIKSKALHQDHSAGFIIFHGPSPAYHTHGQIDFSLAYLFPFGSFTSQRPQTVLSFIFPNDFLKFFGKTSE